MIRSITLQNFKSFGEPQTVPLEAITVLVGPNNSGKSNFMSVGRFVRNYTRSARDSILIEGGEDALVHRPPHGDGVVRFTITGDEGTANIQLGDPNSPAVTTDAEKTLQALARSHVLQLRLDALRADAPIVEKPTLDADGRGLAALLMFWRGADPERAERLEAFVHKTIKEVRNVLARPAPTPGHARLVVRQQDNETFEAPQLSDGLMYFIGLAVSVIALAPGTILFLEEPEQGIHPRRLGEVVDLLRTAASSGTQIVLATHSPTLLNSFRDDPEAIVLFRRGENGTQVRRLLDVPRLKEALEQYNAGPGELLADGFFNDPF
jgi:predicted ATPase